ncbi:MAG TPA: 16S rRNA (cytosine(967)-C(5))-methyltransferase RsmB [Candidatus Methylomirabilis sp.]|nr:16S rRNA (cytosine(967)-C(5))-methyltransferase RsmB [Candidatus Methylomirabilis sp.]
MSRPVMVRPRGGDTEKRREEGAASSPGPRVPRGARWRREDPRALALDVLRRVEAAGAYANLLLDARLRQGGLSPQDRALATELAYGVLRWQGRLDWILAGVLDRPIHALDPPVRQVLRLGAYQLRILSRIPDFAAVDEAVRLIRAAGAGRSAGYVNAVLRELTRRPARPEIDPLRDPVGYWSTAGSHPRWLAERWVARLGAEVAGRLMAANNTVPPLSVVTNTRAAGVEEVRRALTAAAPSLEPGRFHPGVFHLRGAGGPADLPGFREGWLIPMDEAGVLPVLALDLAPGLRVLDACAGGGGKSALIAAGVGPDGEVLAVDRSQRAVRRLETAISRLDLSAVKPSLADARTAGAAWPGQFPRVLLDAPCTGLGTIRRRPEIKWRRRPEDITSAAATQAELLAGVAGAVAEGGLLVYCTCSLEPEETDAVIADFLALHQEFHLEGPGPVVPGLELSDADGLLRAWPHRHGTDGFFVARLRRDR